jgi:cyclic beta-1,2-glucan synthetase
MTATHPRRTANGRPSEDPVRAEIFGAERLERRAEEMAAADVLLPPGARGRALLPRVAENGRALRAAYGEVAASLRGRRAIVPAAEWLVDNFHVVEEQVREIRDDLPAGFYRELPKSAAGPLAGFPRVYALAWEFVAHTDSRFDPEQLRRFVLAFQRARPLTVGELWAVTISLRVVLVENLRRLADSIVRGLASRAEADALADGLLGFGGAPTEAAARSLLTLAEAPLGTAFAVQLVARLRDLDPAATPALVWLDRRLAAQGTSQDEIVRVELQRQAAMNVTVRNVVQSMELISALDWSAFFESVSLVERELRRDPRYGAMDFATRDAYRHAVEDLARGSGRDELDVAVVARARATGADGDGGERERDVGFWLVGGGRRAFEREIGFRATLVRRALRAYFDAASVGYLGTTFLIAGAALAAPLFAAEAAGAGVGTLLLLGVCGAFCASDLAFALVNRCVAAAVRPRVLPRLELRDGVPPELRTVVVAPSMLSSAAVVEELLGRLEVHYLANQDGDVRFALLTDWTDAAAETRADDAGLLAAARAGVATLNERHGGMVDGGARFLHFHRRRLWNPSEGTWMGWERKRGKLSEFNRLLRGATDTSFLPAADAVPTGVRYVVTVDADTRVPHGAVARLVGTMAHPLHRPRIDPRSGRVVEGYGVLTPRITPPLPGRRGSVFQRLSAGPAGVDPYAAAVSDVYQDLFGEGNVHGQGRLRRGRLRTRPSPAACRRTRCSATTCSRGSSGAGGAGERRGRSSRTIPVALSGAACATAAAGGSRGRLAAAALARFAGADRAGSWSQHPASGRALEDGGQPAAQPRRARCVPRARRRVVAADVRRRVLDRLRVPDGRRAAPPARRRGDLSAPPRRLGAEPSARRRPRFRPRGRAGRLQRRDAASAGVAHGRRDRADAVSADGVPAAAP